MHIAIMHMILFQRSDIPSFFITSSVHGPTKYLPKKGGILLLKGDRSEIRKSKIPPILGRDLGGPCTKEVMKKLGISEHCFGCPLAIF